MQSQSTPRRKYVARRVERMRGPVIVCAKCGEDWPCVGFLRGLPGHKREVPK